MTAFLISINFSTLSTILKQENLFGKAYLIVFLDVLHQGDLSICQGC